MTRITRHAVEDAKEAALKSLAESAMTRESPDCIEFLLVSPEVHFFWSNFIEFHRLFSWGSIENGPSESKTL